MWCRQLIGTLQGRNGLSYWGGVLALARWCGNMTIMSALAVNWYLSTLQYYVCFHITPYGFLRSTPTSKQRGAAPCSSSLKCFHHDFNHSYFICGFFTLEYQHSIRTVCSSCVFNIRLEVHYWLFLLATLGCWIYF